MSLLPPSPTGITPHAHPLREDDDPILHPERRTQPDLVLPRALCFDSSGHLWGAGQGGLIRWLISPAQITYKIWHPEHGAAGADGISVCAHEGLIYMGHESGLISRFDPESTAWQVINSAHGEGGVGTPFPVRAFGVSPKGTLLAGTDSGLYDLRQHRLIPCPEPVLSLCAAFESLWIGTEGGLWQWQLGASWEQIDLGFALNGVTVLQVIEGALWAGGINGLARLTEQGVAQLAVEGAVKGIALAGTQVYLLSSAGLWLGDIEGQTWAHTPGRAGLLAARPSLWVIGEGDALDVTFIGSDAPSRPLLPPLEETPHDGWRSFTAGDELWVQSSAGTIWQQTGKTKTWHKFDHPSGSALSGVIALGDLRLLGFESARGIGIIHEGAIIYPVEAQAIRYVTRLSLGGQGIEAETLMGNWQSNDGSVWQKQGN